MIPTSIRVLAFALSALVPTSALLAQTPEPPKVEFPAASPLSTLKQRVGLTDIEIAYSRPGVKGRQIFGGLEAYGKVWRTGANSATKIKFSTPVKVNGADIAAGTYEIFSIPDPAEWTLIIAKDSSNWGAYSYDAKNDVVRVKAKPVKLADLVETFTIDVNDIRNESASLNFSWEKTRVSVKLEVDVTTTLTAAIEAAVASQGKKSAGFYYGAAQFYYEKGLDLNKAKSWIEEATAGAKPAFYMMHLKAKILAKLGDKAGAIAAAKHSSELAVVAEGAQSGFVKMNQDLVESLK